MHKNLERDMGANASDQKNGLPAGWRRLWLPFFSLLLSGFFLVAWVNQIAAKTPEPVPLAQAFAFDLRIDKSLQPSTFTVGPNNIYVINVSRVGTERVTIAPTIEDVLPANITVRSISAEDWNCATSTATVVSCNYIGDLTPEPQSFRPINVTVNVSSSAVPGVPNTARITFPTDDADPSNNSSTVPTPIDSVDLEIDKTINPSFADVNQVITYTMVITNNGPVVANNVVLSDTLSSYLQYHYATATPGWITYTRNGTQYISWSLPSMSIGQRLTFLLPATTTQSAAGRQIVNTARVSSSNLSDWNTANNSDTATLVMNSLDIVKTVDRATADVGEEIEFTVRVSNIGTTQATNVRIIDVFTDTLDIVEASLNGVTFVQSGNTVNRLVGNLASGSSATLRVTARGNSDITDFLQVSNYATVEWGATTPRARRDSNIVYVDITPAPALLVTKTANIPDLVTVARSQTIVYTISVENAGSVEAGDIYIEDQLNSNLNFVSYNLGSLVLNVDIVEVEVSDSGRRHVWRLIDPLYPGDAPIEITVQATVRSDAPNAGVVRNSVIVSSSDVPEPICDPCTVQHTINIPEAPDISATYSVTPSQAQVNETFTFKIKVTNESSSTMTNVRVTDEYPGVVDFQTVQTDKGTPSTNSTTRTFIVTVGSLIPNESVNITVVMKVNSTATTAATHRTTADIVWDPSYEITTNSVSFRVLPSGSLPGTGGQPAASLSAAAGPASSVLPWMVGLAALGLAILGLAGLAYSMWARRRRPLWATWYARAGVTLLAAALLFAVAAWGLGQVTRQPAQLASIAGQKPPLATSVAPVATRSRPAKTHAPEDLSQYLPTPTPSTLPDYPIPTPQITLTPSQDGVLPDPSAVTRILIPSLALDTIVKYVPFDGDTWLIGGLKQEVAWMGDTSWPGLGGNTGLAGHIDLFNGEEGPFSRLGELKPGDQVILYTEQNLYTYVVREQVVVGDTDMSVIGQTEKPQLTLITCTGWDKELKLYLQRLVVFSDLLEVKRLPTTASAP